MQWLQAGCSVLNTVSSARLLVMAERRARPLRWSRTRVSAVSRAEGRAQQRRKPAARETTQQERLHEAERTEAAEAVEATLQARSDYQALLLRLLDLSERFQGTLSEQQLALWLHLEDALLDYADLLSQIYYEAGLRQSRDGR